MWALGRAPVGGLSPGQGSGGGAASAGSCSGAGGKRRRPTWAAGTHASSASPLVPCPGPRATHSFVIGLLLLELLHHDAPLLVLAPLVLKPDPDHAGTEAGHLHQLLLHERVGPGVGGVAGPQGVQLLLVQHSPHAGGLLWLLVDVGPQGRLPGGDGLGCGARGAVSGPGRPPAPLPDNGQLFAASTDKAGAAEVGVRGAKGRIKSRSLISEVNAQ